MLPQHARVCFFVCVCFWCAAQTTAQRLKKYDSSRRPADHQTDASDHSTESLSLRGNEDKCDTDSVSNKPGLSGLTQTGTGSSLWTTNNFRRRIFFFC